MADNSYHLNYVRLLVKDKSCPLFGHGETNLIAFDWGGHKSVSDTDSIIFFQHFRAILCDQT